MNIAATLSSERMDWETPQDLFDAMDRRFKFTLDAAATHATAKCSHYYTPEIDGLAQPWEGSVFLNPPYGRELPRWMAKARASALEGATVVCLVPVRPDTRWWQDLVTAPLGVLEGSYWQPDSQKLVIIASEGTTEIQFMRGRLRFVGARHGAPFPSATVAYIGRAR